MPVSETSNIVFLNDLKLRQPKQELGKDDFLKLLMTQMKYQDPLQPMDNNEYIAQMAQLSTLEQMTNMTKEFTSLRALQLVGKTVTARPVGTQSDMLESITGTVEKVLIDKSNVTLIVDGRSIDINDISGVINNNG